MPFYSVTLHMKSGKALILDQVLEFEWAQDRLGKKLTIKQNTSADNCLLMAALAICEIEAITYKLVQP